MKFFVGLDVSLAETAICLVDADGIIIAEGGCMYMTEYDDRIAGRDKPVLNDAQIRAAADVLWEWLGDGRDQNEPDNHGHLR